MVAGVRNVDLITTRTESEALLLEADLIKRHRPRFNILMKDDKSYPYIHLTEEEWPRLVKHRGTRKKRSGLYFGPYASGTAVNRALTTLQKAFLLRSCSDFSFKNRQRPCLLHQIHRCSAPCCHRISEKAYRELVEEARSFLKGENTSIQDKLSREMAQASENRAYERAAMLRDRIRALGHVRKTQSVRPQTLKDVDVISLAEKDGEFCIQVFIYRDGANCGNRTIFPAAAESATPEAVISAFLSHFYARAPAPLHILVSHHPDEAEIIEEALSRNSGHRVNISRPVRGERRELMAHSARNAEDALVRHRTETAGRRQILEKLGRMLDIPTPRRVEMYDNSHTAGTHPVGAMVAAETEGAAKNTWRRYNIRADAAGDDTAMMHEVLSRRFRGSGSAPAFPDVIVVDGGKAQLNTACQVLSDLGVMNVTVMAVTKRSDRKAGKETYMKPDGTVLDLSSGDPVRRFLQILRDEAHRFAITGHRKKREKSLRISSLDSVPGVGPTRKKALLQYIGGLPAVRDASVEELSHVPGINTKTAKKIYDTLHPAG